MGALDVVPIVLKVYSIVVVHITPLTSGKNGRLLKMLRRAVYLEQPHTGE